MTGEASWLLDASGARKYVTGDEKRRFIAAARQSAPATRAFCLLLAYTGCRISEALAVTPHHLDFGEGKVVFRTLKRRKIIHRAVPVPMWLLRMLGRLAAGMQDDERLWPICRQTAWRSVKQVMQEARISGGQAMPKGLRHGFGIANAEHRIPLGVTQNWMGHARLETTVGYQQAVGPEERAFAEKMW